MVVEEVVQEMKLGGEVAEVEGHRNLEGEEPVSRNLEAMEEVPEGQSLRLAQVREGEEVAAFRQRQRLKLGRMSPWEAVAGGRQILLEEVVAQMKCACPRTEGGH